MNIRANGVFRQPEDGSPFYPKYLTSISPPFGIGGQARRSLNVKAYTSVGGSTGGAESGPAFVVSSDGVSPAELARFCFRWIRRAALSFCRSNRRISFWRFLKVSMCPVYSPNRNGHICPVVPIYLTSGAPASHAHRLGDRARIHRAHPQSLDAPH